MIAGLPTFAGACVAFALIASVGLPVCADQGRVSLVLRFHDCSGAPVPITSLTLTDVDGAITRGGRAPGTSAVIIDRASRGIALVAETALGTCRLHVVPHRLEGGEIVDLELHPGIGNPSYQSRMIRGFAVYDGWAQFCSLRRTVVSTDPVLRYTFGG